MIVYKSNCLFSLHFLCYIELRVSGGLFYGHANPAAIQQEDTQESNSKLHPVEVNPFLNRYVLNFVFYYLKNNL